MRSNTDIQWWIKYYTNARNSAERSRDYALAVGNHDKAAEEAERMAWRDRQIAALEATLAQRESGVRHDR